MEIKDINYIVLSWRLYLSDTNFWQKLSNEKNIPLHIGGNAL